MQITKNNIIETLNNLNIDYKDDNKNWILVKCPLHNDKIMKNAGIDSNTGVFHCFSCKQNMHITKLVQNTIGLSYRKSLEYITGEKVPSSYIAPIDYKLKQNKVEYKKEEEKKVIKKDNKILEDFDPKSFYYTRIRGFTKEFCKEFGIKQCTNNWYENYFIIPIKDKNKNIDDFEARKLNQKEYYDYMKVSEEDFEAFIKVKRYILKKYRVYSEVEKKYIDNSILLYLLKPKVLYKSDSQVKKTLFNIDNLDFNEDLWISEGIGSVPKVYNHITKNITTTFGSEVSDAQIEYLNKFKKRKIIISDCDEASLITIEALNQKVSDLWVVNVLSDDKDTDFVDKLKNAEIIRSIQYVMQEYKIFD